MPVDKLSVQQFAEKIKEKYPDYKDMDDSTLVSKIIDKHPEYKERVNFNAPAPKEQALPAGVSAPETTTTNPADEFSGKVFDAQKRIADYVASPKIKSAVNKVTGDAVANDYYQHLASGGSMKQDATRNNQLLPPRLKQEEDQSASDYMAAAQQNPELLRPVLAEAKRQNPKDAAELSHAMYLADASARDHDPERVKRNADKIQRRELDYDIKNGQVIKPEGILASAFRGAKNHSDAIDRYDYLQKHSDAEIAQDIGNNKDKYDPDTPIPKAASGGVYGAAASLADLVGGSASQMLKMSGPARVLGALGPEAGAVGALIGQAGGGLDFHHVAYSQTFDKTYHDYMRTHPDAYPTDAIKEARKQAELSGALAYGQGVLLGGIGAKGKAAAAADFAPLSNKFTKVMSSIGERAKEIAPEVVGQGGIAGAIKAIENHSQGKNTLDDVSDAAGGAALFAAGFAAMRAKEVTPEAKKVLVEGYAKMNPDAVNRVAAINVHNGTLTPEEAIGIKQEIEAHAANATGSDIHAALTPDGEKALADVKEKGVPEKVNKDLLKVAKENGIEFEPEETPSAENIINRLKYKQSHEKVPDVFEKAPEPEKATEPTAEAPEEKPKISVIRPEENAPPRVVEHVQAPEEGSAPEPAAEGERTTGITHAQTDEAAKRFGLDEYEKTPETIEKWDKEADARIEKDPNAIPDLIGRMRKGEMPDHVEQRMMARYGADLEAKLAADPLNNEKISAFNEFRKLSDRVGGSSVGKSLRARVGERKVEETLPDYLMKEMEVQNVDELTDAQKANVVKEHTEGQKKLAAMQDAYAKLEAEHARLKAEKTVSKKQTKIVGKKTAEQYAAERQAIKDKIKEKLNKSRGQISSSLAFGAERYVEIAPDVAKLLYSYAHEGISKLPAVVAKLKEDIGEHLPEATDKDYHDLIAGKYNERKATEGELRAQVRDLKLEAKLHSRLSDLEKGEAPTTERAKVERNREIKALQEKMKPGEKLAAAKTRNETATKKLQEKLASGDYNKAKPEVKNILEDKEIQKQFPELYKRAVAAKDAYINVQQDREIRLIKDKYAQRNKAQKVRDWGAEILNVPRSIMSSVDFSAPLRQGAVPTIAHPFLASKAAGEMFKSAFSQKHFDRWFHDLRNSPEFQIMEKSGLYVANPHDYRLTAKEEAFTSNLAEKIPFLGKVIKGSENAYVMYLNKLRTDLFKQGAAVLEGQGKTLDNAAEDYKGLASYVNHSTGRGSLPEFMQGAAPLLNGMFFSPRLMASRLNLLNPVYYYKLPKAVRVSALRDMAIFIGFGTTVLGLAKANGLSVEDDPRSTDFGKIKDGDTRYDIWGGFQPYIRVMSQLFSGETKSTTNGKINELNGKGPFGQTRADVVERFFRGKLAPVPSMTWDFISGRDAVGKKFDPVAEGINHFTPLIYSDVKDAMQTGGVSKAIAPFLASTFGVGVNTYQKREPKVKKNDKPSFQ